MQGHVQINDQRFEVTTERRGEQIEVCVGTQTFQIDLSAAQDGFLATLAGEEIRLSLADEAHASLRGGENLSLDFNEVPFDVQFQRARKSTSSASSAGVGAEADDNSITAFMPGTIVRIDVEEGQTVEQGQVLLILEAMKMENEIKAPRDCVVEGVHTTSGANVNKGELLLQLSD